MNPDDSSNSSNSIVKSSESIYAGKRSRNACSELAFNSTVRIASTSSIEKIVSPFGLITDECPLCSMPLPSCPTRLTPTT